MELLTLEPVGLFRHNDFVVLFMDNPVGRALFLASAATPRDYLADSIGMVLAEAEGDLAALNSDFNEYAGTYWVTMDKTSIPRNLPNHKIVVMKRDVVPPEAMEGVPDWNPND